MIAEKVHIKENLICYYITMQKIMICSTMYTIQVAPSDTIPLTTLCRAETKIHKTPKRRVLGE